MLNFGEYLVLTLKLLYNLDSLIEDLTGHIVISIQAI